MFPIVLDLSRLRVLLVGNRAPAVRRLGQLREAGATDLVVFADRPSPVLVEQAGLALRRRLPGPGDFDGAAVVFLVDPPTEQLADLAAAARAAGALVNVEDNIPHCDFHSPSILRRGDLLVTISTHGRSPTLARRLRGWLEQLLPEEWSVRVEELGALRRRWRADGADPATVARRSNALIDARGWLPAAVRKRPAA